MRKREQKIFMLIVFLEALFLSLVFKKVDDIIFAIIVTWVGYVIFCSIQTYKHKKLNKELLIIPSTYTYLIIILLLIIDEVIPSISEISKFIILIYITVLVVIFSVFLKYIKISISAKKIDKENGANKNIFEYYRERISKYSPAELNYIYNRGNKKYSDILISTLLNLSLKEYIEVNDKKIIILKENFDELSQNEKYILNYMRNNNKDKIMLRKFKEILLEETFVDGFQNAIVEDGIKKDLYKVKSINAKELNIKVLKIMILYSFLLPILYFLSEDAILVGAFIFLFMGLIMMGLRKLTNQIHICILSKKGIDILHKLKGLRKYIINYSDIKNSKIKESELWNEYLIYAIIFDLDGKLDDEADMLYQELIDKTKN